MHENDVEWQANKLLALSNFIKEERKKSLENFKTFVPGLSN